MSGCAAASVWAELRTLNLEPLNREPSLKSKSDIRLCHLILKRLGQNYQFLDNYGQINDIDALI